MSHLILLPQGPTLGSLTLRSHLRALTDRLTTSMFFYSNKLQFLGCLLCKVLKIIFFDNAGNVTTSGLIKIRREHCIGFNVG